jgi:large subunit ribosomal protein L14
MLFVESFVTVSDNTQTRNVKCIHLLNGGTSKCALVNRFIVIAIRRYKIKRRLIFKKIYLALILGTKKDTRRINGSFIKVNKNHVILMSEVGKVLGTRLLGPMYREIKKFRFFKFLSLLKKAV